MSNTNMTLEQARNTPYPFREDIKGQPMGKLLDEGRLRLQDLGYVLDRPQYRQAWAAARILMIHRMTQVADQANSQAGYVNVISSGRSYSQRGQIRFATRQGLFVGFVFGLLAVLFVISIGDIIASRSPERQARAAELMTVIPGIQILIIVLILLVFAILIIWLFGRVIDWAMRQFDRRIDQHRQGELGETQVANVIQQALDGNWTAFLNVTLPGRNKADLDVVLVGPGGVYALEVKNYNGQYRNFGEDWEYQAKGRWNKINGSPSRQAKDNATRLGNFLKADDICQYVEDVVVWANPDSPLDIENPTVRVWTLDRLRDELQKLTSINKVPVATREQINEKLTKLCEKQADEQWYAK